MDLNQIGSIFGIVSGAISIGTWAFGIMRTARSKAPTAPPPQAVSSSEPSAATQQWPASSSPYPPSAPVYPGYPVQSAAAQPTRRFLTHPWLALVGGIAFILLAIGAAAGGAQTHPSDIGVVLLVAGYLGIMGVWIYTIVQTIRLKRWGWLVGALLLSIYASLAFAIFGPTTRAAPRA